MVNTEYWIIQSEELINPGGSSGTDTDENDKILLHQNSSENYNNFLILEQKDWVSVYEKSCFFLWKSFHPDRK